MRIGLLCNNKMAMPALGRMAAEGVLCGIATSDKDRDVTTVFKEKAAEYAVPYCCVARSNYKELLPQWMAEMNADIIFVMTFPWPIPASVFSLTSSGFLNFHYGLLPEMRGADPIFESIRQRRPVAGLTVHKVDEGLDTGPIVCREEIPINAELTYGMLSAQLAYLGEKVCASLIEILRSGKNIEYRPQDESLAAYWPRVGAGQFRVAWQTMDAAAIKALVKSCNPIAKGIPVVINGWKIGVCETDIVNLQGDASYLCPGTIVAIDAQNGLIVYCCDGKGLKLEVVYTEEGYLPGYKLGFFGIKSGMAFS